MKTAINHIATWWEALVNPEIAGRLVLETDRRPGFDRFMITGTIVFYALYGFTMGLFRGFLPGIISGLKFPFIYLLTILVCFPAFYVLNCLYGPGLKVRHCIRLLMIAVSANGAAIASYSLFSLFFTLTTSKAGYHFLIVMHIIVLGMAGMASLVVVVLIFRATAAALGKRLRPVFVLAWGVLYALIGTQMAWVLRPIVGSWGQRYAAFRPLGGSFIERVYQLLSQLF